MADGEIIIDVVLDDGSVAQGVARVDKSLGGIGESAEKASLSIGKIVTALGLVALAKKGIDLVRDSIHGAFQRIDTMEQFERVMNVMIDDTDAVAASMDRLQDIVEGTSMRTDVMANGIQNFVTRGMEIDQATDTVEAWGNAVAFYGDGSNEQFENVSDALQNMVAKGKVGMDQLNRLYDSGIPAVEMYADAVGMEVGEVQDALSNGEISAEDFVNTVTDSLMKGTSEFPSVAGAMEDLGMSWGSVLENMGNYVQLGVTDIITAIDDMLEQNGLPDMRTMIDEFGQAFGNALSNLADKIPDIVAKIKEIYNALEPWMPLIKGIAVAVGAFISAFAGIQSVIGIINMVRNAIMLMNAALLANPVGLMVAAVVAAVALIYIYWEPISEFFMNLWERVKEVSLAIWEPIQEAWNTSVEWLQEVWTGISEWFSELWESIKEIFMLVWEPIQEAWQEVVEFFTEIWLDLVEFFAELWEDIKETMLEIWEPIQEIWSEVVEFFVELWNNVTEVTTEIWDMIVEVIVGAWNIILDFITSVLEVISSLISAYWNAIRTVISTVLSVISTVVQTYWNIIRTVIETVMNVIKTVIKTAWNVIKTIIQTVINIIKTIIQTTWNVIKGIISAVMSIIQGDISGAWNAIKGIISSVMSGISSVISSIWNAIKSIISSVLNGISSTISSIFNGLIGIVSSAMSGVRSAVSTGINGALSVITGIASSFFDAGRNIVSSIADGITGAISLVTDAIGNVTSKIRDFLPFSPAKEGALRDIMDIQIGQSIAKAIDKGKSSALKSMANLTDGLDDEIEPTVNINRLRGAKPALGIVGQPISSNVVYSEKRRRSQNEPITIVVKPSNVEMDGRTVGEITWEVVDENIERNKGIYDRFRG